MSEFKSGASDGWFTSYSSSYSSARAGTGALSSSTSSPAKVGQRKVGFPTNYYYCYQALLKFDTSAIPDDAEITDVTLSLYVSGKSGGATLRARIVDDYGSIDTGDFIAGADASAAGPIVGYQTLAGLSTGAYNDLANPVDDSYLDAINKTGDTCILVDTEAFESGTAPTATDTADFRIGTHSGEDYDPKLTVLFTSSATVAGAVAGMTFTALPASDVETGGQAIIAGAVASMAFEAVPGDRIKEVTVTGAVAGLAMAAVAGSVSAVGRLTVEVGAVGSAALGRLAGAISARVPTRFRGSAGNARPRGGGRSTRG